MKPADREGAARAIRAFIEALGYERGAAELEGTPERVAAAFIDELLSGERSDLAELIASGSEALSGKPLGLVLVRDIAVTTICPHHLLPAVGKASVAYLPSLALASIADLIG